MRFSNMIYVLAFGGLTAAGAMAGCSDGGETTSSAGGGGSSTSGPPCAPKDALCNQVKSDCIALADYSGSETTTLRMSFLSLSKPTALASGLVKGIVENGVLMNLATCNLSGQGTFNWLLQFDTKTGKLRTGGAKPNSDPTTGYSFISGEMIGGIAIDPVEVDAPVAADGTFATAMGANVVVPIFLDINATQSVLLPLKAAQLSGKLSEDKNCIGIYNAEKLDPANNCQSEVDVPAFDPTSGTLEGYITLEDADSVIVDALKQSLCVLLSGDSAQYGDGGSPNKCKRDMNNAIIFQGDWCDATNSAGGCQDSMQLGAQFAASAVKVN